MTVFFPRKRENLASQYIEKVEQYLQADTAGTNITKKKLVNVPR